MNACLSLLAMALDGGATDALVNPALEVHRWEDAGASGPPLRLAAGVSADLWTSSGVHYRFDGTRLGELSFHSGAERDLEEVVSDGQGGLLTVSRTPEGRFLTRHDREGRELWSRIIGERRRQRSPGALSNEVVGARVAGIDSTGTIHVAGWLQGCVDLSGKARRRRCATWWNAGHPDGPELDSPPLLLFVNQYDAQGTWKRTLPFDRMRDGQVAVDRSGVLAVTAMWSPSGAIDIRAPDGARVIRAPARKPPAPDLVSLVASFRPDGHLLDVAELAAGQYSVIRSQAFDGAGRLWSFVEFTRDLTVSQRGRAKVLVPGAQCFIVLTSAPPGGSWEHRFLECAPPGKVRDFPWQAFATPLPDGQLLLANIPAEVAAGDAMGSIDEPYIPTRSQSLSLMVLAEGHPRWHVVTGGVNHAVGLADSWLCFTQLDRKTACVRPRR